MFTIIHVLINKYSLISYILWNVVSSVLGTPYPKEPSYLKSCVIITPMSVFTVFLQIARPQIQLPLTSFILKVFSLNLLKLDQESHHSFKCLSFIFGHILGIRIINKYINKNRGKLFRDKIYMRVCMCVLIFHLEKIFF